MNLHTDPIIVDRCAEHLVPGMPDTVEGIFYASTGSGKFTVGPARDTVYAPGS